MEFGPLKVSTMTWTAGVSGTIDLDAIFNSLTLISGNDARTGIVHLINKDRTASRPEGLALGRKFGKNVTMRVKSEGADKLLNVKLFGNGCIQLTGAKTVDDGANACRIVAEALCVAGQIPDPHYFDLRIRMINSDMRASLGLKRAYLYEKWRAEVTSCIVYDPLTYPALKMLLFYTPGVPIESQAGTCPCSKHCSTKRNAKHRKCVKVTVALFESGCVIITGSILPEEAQYVRSHIIRRVMDEGPQAYIVKEDPTVVMARILARYRSAATPSAAPGEA